MIPFASVEGDGRNGFKIAFVSVGSKIHPEDYVMRALREISAYSRVVAVSTFYKTQFLKSDGTLSYRPEDVFVNGIFAVETSFSCREFRDNVLRKVEQALGRVRGESKFEARKIDLDLVLFGTEVCHDADLKLPALDIRSRDFVAVPLLELIPHFVMPDTQQPLSEIAKKTMNTQMRPDMEFTGRLRKDIQK